MDFENIVHDQAPRLEARTRPQPEFRISLTLAVTDAQALWTAAAAKLLSSPGMSLDDVLDVIGPREDPSITDCVALMAKPIALPGCVLDDFWIDSLQGCPPRTDVSPGVPTQRPASPEAAIRRPPGTHRAPAGLRLCLIPPGAMAVPVN
ncbi:hypothetical protein BH10PSE14_BH10PSE14_13860 [soil metagenome]